MEHRDTASEPVRLPDPCLVVLVGATAAGKSAWAAEQFAPDLVVSSDGLRAVVGAGERDQRASRDAFEVLELIVSKRLARGLTTVIDSTGLDPKRRAGAAHRARQRRAPAGGSHGARLRPAALALRLPGPPGDVGQDAFRLSDADGAESVRRFAEVIGAFRPAG